MMGAETDATRGGLTRRGVLLGATGAVVAVAAPGGAVWASAAGIPPGVFASGVASGDPDESSVVLWTRVDPAPHVVGGAMGGLGPVEIGWRVRRVGRDWGPERTAAVSDDTGWCLKVLATDLRPDTAYEYQFRVGDQLSPVGRTRTLPPPGKPVDKATFAVVDCMSLGIDVVRHHTALDHLAGSAASYVLMQGDYVYEGRNVDPGFQGIARTLAQYRARYGQVHRRPQMLRLRGAIPFFCCPDDHEWWNDLVAEELPGTALGRYNAAVQAFWENQPVRGELRTLPDGRVYVPLFRRIRHGDVLDLLMTDGRQSSGGPDGMYDDAQVTAITDTYRHSPRTWVGLSSGRPIADHQGDPRVWGGTDETAIRDLMANRPNTAVVSGDWHIGMVTSARAADGRLATVEFVNPPVSSAPHSVQGTAGDRLAVYNGRWGYTLHEVTETGWRADYWMCANVVAPGAPVVLGGSWRVDPGAKVAVQEAGST